MKKLRWLTLAFILLLIGLMIVPLLWANIQKSDQQISSPQDNGVLSATFRIIEWWYSRRFEPSGITSRASENLNLTVGQGATHPTISMDGRWIAFAARVTGGIDETFQEKSTVFVLDRGTNQIDSVPLLNSPEAQQIAHHPSISADGRFVVYELATARLRDNRVEARTEIALYNIREKEAIIISRSQDGDSANNDSYFPSLSADGRYIIFSSLASNLIPNDTNQREEVFIYDRSLGVMERVSLAENGQEANGRSCCGSISGDGRMVAFASDAPNLLLSEEKQTFGFFVRDRSRGETQLVALYDVPDPFFEMSGWVAQQPMLSGDGNFLAYTKILRDEPGNGWPAVFIYSRSTGESEQLVLSRNAPMRNSPKMASISWDGRYLAFDWVGDNVIA